MVDISSTRQSIPRKAPSQLNFNKTGDSILKESHLSVQKKTVILNNIPFTETYISPTFAQTKNLRL